VLSSGVHAVRLKGSPSVQQRVEEPASDDGADPKLVLALRGIFAVLLGLAAFVLPGVTLALLVALFGAYAVVDGVLAIIAGVRAAERHERWWSPVLKGLAGIAAGVLAFVWPALTALALLYLIAGWAIVTGVLEIVAAVHLHRAHGEWLLVLNGVLSVLFGLLVIVWPGAGVLTLLWLIGTYSIVFGVVLLVLAFRLRNLHGRARQSVAR